MIRRRWKLVLAAVIFVLIAIRIALPAIMLRQANVFLASYSEVFDAKLADIDISFIRMAYRLEGFEVKLKKDRSPVLFVASTDVSLAWRELLKGVILTDIYVKDARLKYSPDLQEGFRQMAAENERKEKSKAPQEKKQDKKEAQQKEETIKDKFFPLRIERLEIVDSSFEYSAEKNAPEGKRLVADQFRLKVSNITPGKEKSRTVATFESRLQRSAKLKGVAQMRVSKEVMDWDVDAELRGFDLTYANPFLLDLVPFSFTTGTLDVFAEAKSENGAIIGYVKPFMTNVDVIARKEKFRSAKHFFAEIAVALGNVILKKPKYKSVATKLDFKKAGPGAELKFDQLGALSNAIEHRLDRAIAPSVEDEVKLD